MGCLSRTAIIITSLILLLSTPIMAGWRSQPDDAVLLGRLDAALMPVHQEMAAAWADLNAAFGQAYQQWTRYRWPELAKSVMLIREQELRILAAANDGLAVLDDHVIPPCAADYAAVERVGFLLIGDGIDGVHALNPVGLRRVSVGIDLLLGGYADDIRAMTACA